jgi:hypothetical protein
MIAVRSRNQSFGSLPSAADFKTMSSDNSKSNSSPVIVYFVVQINQKTSEHIDWRNMAWYKRKIKADSAAERIKEEYPDFDVRVIERH